MEQDGERSSISCEDDDFRDTSVQSFAIKLSEKKSRVLQEEGNLRCFVGTFLQLSVVRRLLDKVKNGNGQFRIREGVCFGVNLCHIVASR